MKENDDIKNKNERDYQQGWAELDKNKRLAQRTKQRELQQAEYLEQQKEYELENKLKQAAKKASGRVSKSRSRILSNYAHRKDLHSYFKHFTNSQGVKFKQYTTARLHNINYSFAKTGKNSLSALKTSLNHSSRTVKRDAKEWSDILMPSNLFYGSNTNGKIISYNEFIKDADKHLSFYDELTSNQKFKDDTKLKADFAKASRLRSSYFAKLKNLLPRNHPDHKTLVEKLTKWENEKYKDTHLDADKNKHIIEQLKTYLDKRYKEMGFSQKHRDNKFKVIDNYTRHRRTHQLLKQSAKAKKPINNNSCAIVESVLKFPHKNGELFKHVPKKEILQAGINYFKTYFPKNSIELAALHLDESLDESEETGLNMHVFLSASNGSGLTYRQQYVSFAKQVAEEHPNLFPELLAIDPLKTLSNKLMVSVGQVIQLHFMHFFQQNLLNKYQIAINFLTENERQEFRFIQALVEQDLPISDRQQSRFNALKIDQIRLNNKTTTYSKKSKI